MCMPRGQANTAPLLYSAVTPLHRLLLIPSPPPLAVHRPRQYAETLRETRAGKRTAGGSHVSVEEGSIRVSVGAGVGTPTSTIGRQTAGVAAAAAAAASVDVTRGGDDGGKENDLRRTGLSVEVIGTANVSATEVRVNMDFVACCRGEFEVPRAKGSVVGGVAASGEGRKI